MGMRGFKMASKGNEAMKTAVNLSILALSVLTTVSCQSLIITHSPDYLKFVKTGERIPISEVSSLAASTLGLTPSSQMTWKSLSQGSFFHRPKANVIMSIEGFLNKDIDLNLNHVARYPTADDLPEVKTEKFSEQLRSLPFKSKPMVVDFSAGDNVYDLISQHPTVFGDVSTTLSQVAEKIQNGQSCLNGLNMGTLNVSDDVDLRFLSELHLICSMVDALEKHSDITKDSSPDFMHFKVMGFDKIVDAHGPTVARTKDALHLIEQFIAKVTADLKGMYKDSVVVQVFTVTGEINPHHVRKVRSLMAAAGGVETFAQSIGLAKAFDPDYAAMFNIILWTMILLAVVVFCVSAAIWNMDPGRDSIIYRMTSQRIKKD